MLHPLITEGSDMKLSAPIFRLKRRARLMSREDGIPLNEALDRIARSEGLRDWSLLAAKYAERDPASEIFARLAPGDMTLIGARPMQGKTVLALGVLAQAAKAGRSCAYFTLDQTTEEALGLLAACGVDANTPDLLVDTSDAICAEHIIARLVGAPSGSVVVVDYLQALDHSREKPPLSDQVSALSAFAKERGLIIVMISQIDRRFDAAAKPLPDITDIRMPNRIDISVFSKTCFLREGELIFAAAAHDA